MIKDSGKRIQMAGMVRDVTDDKIRYDLVLDGPMFERWAKHLTDGAKKYTAKNWVGAHTQEELDRFKESAIRHFIQWFRGDFDEDHAAALFFNVNGAEYVGSHMPPTLLGTSTRQGPADRRRCQDYRGSSPARRSAAGFRGFRGGRRKDDRAVEYPTCHAIQEP